MGGFGSAANLELGELPGGVTVAPTAERALPARHPSGGSRRNSPSLNPLKPASPPAATSPLADAPATVDPAEG